MKTATWGFPLVYTCAQASHRISTAFSSCDCRCHFGNLLQTCTTISCFSESNHYEKLRRNLNNIQQQKPDHDGYRNPTSRHNFMHMRDSE